MAFTDILTERFGVTPLQFIVRGIILILLIQVVSFFYNGICIRLKFWRLRSQGMGVPSNYSLLLGHLPLFRQGLRTISKNGASGVPSYTLRLIGINWRTYFPGLDAPPPVIYLDIWPLVLTPIIIVNNTTMCQALVAERFPPRHEQSKHLVRAVAGKRSLVEWDGARHRLWRTRLNPGFSMKNLIGHVATGRVVDEVAIFANRIKALAGPDGEWGEVFQMYPKTVDLTFDIICSVTLDFSPGEQINGPTELQSTFAILRGYIKFKSLALLWNQINPFWYTRYYQAHNTVRRILLPHIHKQLQNSQDPEAKLQAKPTKTVIDLALKEFREEGGSATPNQDFIEDLVGLMKLFIFAGHDTTSINVSFALHYLAQTPDAVRKLRAEHDEVFGKDKTKVADILRESPHLLNSLPYTAAVVKETLRLTSVAASIRVGDNYQLIDPETGIHYPTDGSLIINGVSTLHYSPELWPEPTEFIPDRWVTEDNDSQKGPNTKFAFRPFEMGPMSCIGQELAVIEVKMALVFTIRELDFETNLDEWDRVSGKSSENRPSMLGEEIYQTAIGLGPPTEQLPMRVRRYQEVA